MQVDETRRRAFLAFCMDALVRAIGDEDLEAPWLVAGVPDGLYQGVPDNLFDEAIDGYAFSWGTTDEDWADLCRLFTTTMKRARSLGVEVLS